MLFYVTLCYFMLCYVILYYVVLFYIDIFINCNWVVTRWQQYSTHLHTNSTQNDTKQTIHRIIILYYYNCMVPPSYMRSVVVLLMTVYSSVWSAAICWQNAGGLQIMGLTKVRTYLTKSVCSAQFTGFITLCFSLKRFVSLPNPLTLCVDQDSST